MRQAIRSLGDRLKNRGSAPVISIVIIILLLLCLTFVCWWFIPPSCPPPVANANGPYAVGEGQLLTFNGSGSTGCNLSYQWDFGDGTGQGSGVSPGYTYLDGPAQFSVTLTVIDDSGRAASNTAQVTVTNLPPSAEAGGPYKCQVNQVIQLSGTCNDPGEIDRQSLSCTWDDFGGATVTQAEYTCPPTAGQLTVVLTAADKDGARAQDSAVINVVPTVTPSPTITADPNGPYSGVVGQPVIFDGSASKPTELIRDYTWDFGDTTIQTSQDAVVSHTYTASNTYTVILTVTGQDAASGQVATGTTSATISVPNTPPLAVIRCPPELRSKDGRCLHFDGSRSLDSDGEITAYAWDFNKDGVVDSTEPMAEYCFPADGRHLVTLTVTDDKGAEHRSAIITEIP